MHTFVHNAIQHFFAQTLLTGGVAGVDSGTSLKGKEKARENSTRGDAASSTPPGASIAKKISSQHKVRTSAADRTLDSMFLPPPTQPGDLDNANSTDAVKERRKTREIPQSTCYLSSVLTLRENVKKAKHTGM